MSTPTPSTADSTGSGGLCLPPGRGAAGATAVVESLRELPQLTDLKVDLQSNKLGPGPRRALSKHLGPCHTNHAPGEEEKEKLRATFAALPVLQKFIFL